jgi:hypothetical protein
MIPTYDETSIAGVCVSSHHGIFFNFSITKWPLLDLSRRCVCVCVCVCVFVCVCVCVLFVGEVEVPAN